MRQIPGRPAFAAGGYTPPDNGIFIDCSRFVHVNISQAANDCGDDLEDSSRSSRSGPARPRRPPRSRASWRCCRPGDRSPARATSTRLLYGRSTQTTPTAFHDIATGSNEMPCTPGSSTGCPAGGLYGFQAASGYDCATGLGSVDVANLITAWTAARQASRRRRSTPPRRRRRSGRPRDPHGEHRRATTDRPARSRGS